MKENKMSVDEAKKEWINLGYTDEEAIKLATIALSYDGIGTQFDSAEDAAKWLLEATKSDCKYYSDSLISAYKIFGIK